MFKSTKLLVAVTGLVLFLVVEAVIGVCLQFIRRPILVLNRESVGGLGSEFENKSSLIPLGRGLRLVFDASDRSFNQSIGLVTGRDVITATCHPLDESEKGNCASQGKFNLAIYSDSFGGFDGFLGGLRYFGFLAIAYFLILGSICVWVFKFPTNIKEAFWKEVVLASIGIIAAFGLALWIIHMAVAERIS